MNLLQAHINLVHITIEPAIPLNLTTTTTTTCITTNASSSISPTLDETTATFASVSTPTPPPSPPFALTYSKSTECKQQHLSQHHNEQQQHDDDVGGMKHNYYCPTDIANLDSSLSGTALTTNGDLVLNTPSSSASFANAASASSVTKTYISRIEHFITNIDEDENDTQEIKVNLVENHV